MWKSVIEYITHDKKGGSQFPHKFLQPFMITKRVVSFHFEKILTTESAACESSNLENFWQIFWERQVNKRKFREQNSSIELSNYPKLIKKMKPFLTVHQCRFENLPVSLSSYENNMLKISQ